MKMGKSWGLWNTLYKDPFCNIGLLIFKWLIIQINSGGGIYDINGIKEGQQSLFIFKNYVC